MNIRETKKNKMVAKSSEVNNSKILITGGSGLLGSRLTEILISKGYQVFHLSQSKKENLSYPVFNWKPGDNYIDPEALNGITILIHLAGAGIGENRWTVKRKKILYNSRILSTKLIVDQINDRREKGLSVPSTIIFGSAIGIYGNRGDEICTTKTGKGNDFLSNLTADWEKEALRMSTNKSHITIIRTGVVLSENGGALPQMMKGHKFGIAIIPGNGKQWISTIKIDDWCMMVINSLDQKEEIRIINGVDGNPKPYHQFLKEQYQLKGSFFFKIGIPAFIFRWVLGERSQLLLQSQRVIDQ